MPVKVKGLQQELRSVQAGFDKFNEKKRLITVRVQLEALKRLIVASPVDTGWYRVSHIYSVDIPSTLLPPKPPKKGKKKKGEDTKGAGKQLQDAQIILNTKDLFKEGGYKSFITNNVPYAGVLESGTSKQAPKGIYKIVEKQIDILWGRLQKFVLT